MTRLLLAAAASALALIAVEFRFPSAPDVEDAPRLRPFDPDARVDAVLHRACANCHSNETRLPWFGRAGPIAWIILRDVHKGRERLNFSEGDSLGANEREEIYDAVSDRSMPPKRYTILHGEARLSPKDLAILEAWASRSVASSGAAVP